MIASFLTTWGGFAGAIVTLAWLGFGGRHESRQLLEFGRISAPKRLEHRGTDASPERVIFHFDRIPNSIFLIGSHTPVAERLVVAALAPGLDPEARERAVRRIRSTAVERTEKIRWERDGVIYHLSEDDPARGLGNVRGQWFFVMHPLGTLPPSPRGFVHLGPITSRGLNRWPDITFLLWTDGAWAPDGIDRSFHLREQLMTHLRARQTDPSQVYFYVVSGAAVDEYDSESWEVQYYHEVLAEMDRLFAEGKLVAARE